MPCTAAAWFPLVLIRSVLVDLSSNLSALIMLVNRWSDIVEWPKGWYWLTQDDDMCMTMTQTHDSTYDAIIFSSSRPTKKHSRNCALWAIEHSDQSSSMTGSENTKKERTRWCHKLGIYAPPIPLIQSGGLNHIWHVGWPPDVFLKFEFQIDHSPKAYVSIFGLCTPFGSTMGVQNFGWGHYPSQRCSEKNGVCYKAYILITACCKGLPPSDGCPTILY